MQLPVAATNGRGSEVFSRVTFFNPDAAQAAVRNAASKPAQESSNRRSSLGVSVKPYIPRHNEGTFSRVCMLVVTWPTGIPTGTVDVELSSACLVKRLVCGVGHDKVLHMDGIPYFCQPSKASPTTATLKLPSEYRHSQEQFIFKRFQKLRFKLEEKFGSGSVVSMHVHQKLPPHHDSPLALKTTRASGTVCIPAASNSSGGSQGGNIPFRSNSSKAPTMGRTLGTYTSGRSSSGRWNELDPVDSGLLSTLDFMLDFGRPSERKGPRLSLPQPVEQEESVEEVAVKLQKLFGKFGEVESVRVMEATDGKQHPIGRAQVCMASSQMSQAAQEALSGKEEFGTGFMWVKLNCWYSVVLDSRTHKAIKGRLQHAEAQLSQVFPSVKVTTKELVATANHKTPGGAAGATGSSVSGGKWSIRLESANEQELEAARKMIQSCLQGRAFDAGSADALACLLTPRGKAYLQGLEETYSESILQDGEEEIADTLHIRWERLRNRLVLFGTDFKVEMAIQDIMSYLEAQSAEIERRVALTRILFGVFLRSFDEQSSLLMQRSGVSSVNIDVTGRGLKLRGTAAALNAAEAYIAGMKVQPSPDPRSGSGPVAVQSLEVGGGTMECAVCRCEADNTYCLAICAHPYCNGCIRMMLEVAARSNDFPVKCCMEGCTEPVSLVDFHALLASDDLAAAHKASFRAHLDANHQDWGNCPTPDCPQVFRKGQKEFHCDVCQASWCTGCQQKGHPGLTCEQLKQQQGNDAEFQAWKEKHTKPCPECNVPIEKNQGCHHMTCARCKGHFCWLCLAKFTSSQQTYDHLVQKHGGIFDREGPYAVPALPRMPVRNLAGVAARHLARR